MLEILKYIVSHIAELGGAIIAVAFVIKQFWSQSSELNKKMMADYKERNLQLENNNKEKDTRIEKIIKDNAELIIKITAELEKEKAISSQKDEHINNLTTILQGRNPEILELLKEISQGNKDNRTFMQTVYELIKKSHATLDYQTQILEEGKDRNKNIDEASISHKGEVVRIPVPEMTPA